MPKTTTIVSAFLASPSDLEHERAFVSQAIEHWNNANGQSRSIRFELLRWETSIAAGFGSDGQDVINSGIAEDYDILIVLMWSRLGSETPRSKSGTVEEYERAFCRFNNNQDIEIAILFKDYPVDPRKADLDQLRDVLEFERRVQRDGAFSKRFLDDETLNFEINLLLDKCARNYNSQRMIEPAYQENATSNLLKSDSSRVMSDVLDQGSQSELGLFDITDNMTEHSDLAVKSLATIQSSLEVLTTEVTLASSTLHNIASSRPIEGEDAKPVIAKVAAAMDQYSDTIEGVLPTFSENTVLLVNDVRDLIDISYDFVDGSDNQEEPLVKFREVLEMMAFGMQSSAGSVADMRDVVKGLQRTTSGFNKARRRVVVNLDKLVQATFNGKTLVEQALIELDALISNVRRRRLN